jgi:ubiquinone/menaquinone biosynthesis C-methylase UbiE
MVSAPPRLTGVVERMERPDLDTTELGRALRTLARVNQLFGGTRVVLEHLGRLCDGVPGPIRILDVGTGYADIPRAIVRWARQLRRPVEITAIDRHLQTLALASQACARYPEIRLREADALALPFASGSFDLVLASQLLHHMEGTQPVQLLRELSRLARRAVLVNDLRRGAWPHLLTWATLHVVSRSAVIRHDGPMSIRRGYLPMELEALAREAGWKQPRISRHAFFRLALVGVTW